MKKELKLSSMEINKDYFTNRTYNLIKEMEYDSELDRLKGELYICEQDDKKNRLELESLTGTLGRIQGRLEREPQKIFVAIGVFVAFTVFWHIWSYGGDNILLAWAQDLVKVFKLILFLNIFRRIYVYLHHLNPTKARKIKYIVTEKSYTHTIEELEVQINECQRKVLEHYKKIRELKEEITRLEENEE